MHVSFLILVFWLPNRSLNTKKVGTIVLYTHRLSRLAKKAEQVELSYEK